MAVQTNKNRKKETTLNLQLLPGAPASLTAWRQAGLAPCRALASIFLRRFRLFELSSRTCIRLRDILHATRTTIPLADSNRFQAPSGGELAESDSMLALAPRNCIYFAECK